MGERFDTPSLLGAPFEAITVTGLYEAVDSALRRSFPRRAELWVRGEIQSISDRTGHCYIDLADPETARGRDAPVLKVKCWRTTWSRIRDGLDREGIVLEAGMVVTVRGRVDLYRARGEVNFVIDSIDVDALIGRQAARRAGLLRLLEQEGLLQRNSRRPVPPLPLRVGLVASPGSEGWRDFLAQLTGSGFAFHVLAAPTQVQGPMAPVAVAKAITESERAGAEVVVVVRGGGSRADLATFDHERVARAIATSSVPVWTGIGHSGDQAVADLVAHRAFITPTECGQELVRLVAERWTQVGATARRLVLRATRCLEDAAARDRLARHRLVICTRSQLDRHRERMGMRGRRIRRQAPLAMDRARFDVLRRADHLAVSVRSQMARQNDQLDLWRRLLGAYDVERQLQRGYTITLDDAGRIIRRGEGLTAGDLVTTRFVDGRVSSAVVEPVAPATLAVADSGTAARVDGGSGGAIGSEKE